ncbi:DUF2202 domain-containing protein [Thiocapsa marina]|uniref:DUF2202 domain-containing protein n=1 Tax=Thiocapsa marina 5811 TaxID=768671 RepID=F9U8M1_9GAMM|nr:DUF2202 domain-containing protein [Thiocapsa marina]EGV19129.1 Protein of unknown function DUF2202 [Thiocapsa marina 5811]
MKSYRTLVMATLLGASMTLPVLAGNGGPGKGPGAGALPQIDANEAATLSFMREEEKLARDVYLDMNDLWDAVIFVNIAASEQQHMETLLPLLDKYGLPDPAELDIPGWFSDEDLQTLYNGLVDRGGVSYAEALQVGALIEEVDIEDLQLAIEQTDNADLQNAYENLMRGSRNHLRSFVAEIERAGVVYEAQHLDPAIVDAILDSPVERGGSSKKRN